MHLPAYNCGMNTPIPFTFTGKTLLSALLFVAITPWSANQSLHTAAASPASSPQSSESNSRYFPQTGRVVHGSFLRAFDKYGLALTGWPISDEVTENGLQVQYFERMKMEYHPELAGAGTPVQLTRLGAIMSPQPQSARIAAFASTTSRKFFPQTGHSIASPFLKYWQTHGSVEALGYPISEQSLEGGLKVQWFERARLEYHPELAGKTWEIQLTRLGSIALTNTGATTPAPAASTSNAPTAANTSATYTASENLLLSSVNVERAKAGVPPVSAAPDLTDLARSRSADMAARDYFSHTTPEGANIFSMLRSRSIAYSYAGEIIARNNIAPTDRSIQVAIDGFLNSPSHRQIMLDPQYTNVGLGYTRAPNSMSYTTVIFLKR